MNTIAKTTCFKFGQFELRPAERQLLVSGRAATLTHRAFDVLVALVERAGQLCTKAELLDTVWRGLVVEEGNLMVHISALRKVLGPEVIQTVPGHGYRLCAVLENPAPQQHSLEQPAEHTGAESAITSPLLPASTVRAAPPRLAKLIGRKRELDLLLRLLQAHRVVTITGAAGVGKTHLAHAVAELSVGRHRDGVLWVELAAIREPALVPAVIAQAMGVSLEPNLSPLDALIRLLKPLSLLVVLDNAEHLQKPLATLVAEVEGCAGENCILVTSQVRLNLPQEHTVRLAPLTLPERDIGTDQALNYEAVALFVARVQALEWRFKVTPDNLPGIVSICRRLDGVALSLELAAARVPSLGVQTLSDLLNERFRLLTISSKRRTSRHQTLMSAFEWSYSLLTEPQQALFRRLSVLAGGFTLQEVMPVAGLDEGADLWELIDVLADLVERSLITVDAQPVPRYGFLESTHAFAQQRLAATSELRVVRERHLKYFRDRVEAAARGYSSEEWPDQESWIQKNYANIREALHWSLEGKNDIESGAEMVAALRDFWQDKSLYQEAEFWLDTAARWMERFPPLLQARLHLGIGAISLERGKYVECMPHYLESLRLFKRVGDNRPELGEIYNNLAAACEVTSEFEEARRLRLLALQEYRRTGDRKGEGVGLLNLGASFFTHGPAIEAVGLLREAVTICRETRNESFVVVALAILAESLLDTGQLVQARQAADEAATVQVSTQGTNGNRHFLLLRALARIELHSGHLRAAANHLSESLEILTDTMHAMYIAICLNQCAELAVAAGDAVVAARLLGFSGAWLARNELTLLPNRKAHADSARVAVEDGLGRDRLDVALAEGAKLTVHEALALASTVVTTAA